MAQYWRLTGISTSANGVLELSELQVYEAGVVVSGTLSCTAGGVLTALTDNLSNVITSWPYSAYSQSGFALVWDFGVTAVVEPSLRLGGGSSSDTFPQDVIMQSSADGINWVAYKVAVGITFPGMLTLAPVPVPVASGWVDAFSATNVFVIPVLVDQKLHTVTANNGAVAANIGGRDCVNLTIGPGNAASNLSIIQSEFCQTVDQTWTVEASFYITSHTNNSYIFRFGIGNLSKVLAYVTAVGYFNISIHDSNGGPVFPGGTYGGALVSLNTWHHIAVTRSSNIYNIYYDGTLLTSIATGGDGLQDSTIRIGDESWPFDGYVADFRVTKSCRYTTTFVPPTEIVAPYVDPFWNQTVLAMHMEDETDLKGHVPTSSNLINYNGTGKYGKGLTQATPAIGTSIRYPILPEWDLDSTDFTIDFWYTPTNTTTDSGIAVGCGRDISPSWFILFDNSSMRGRFSKYQAAGSSGITNIFTPNGSLTINIASHIALVGSVGGTVINFYVNGVSLSVATLVPPDYYNPQSGLFLLGSDYWKGCGGVIDDLRITKAARWTTNFTPPTSAFPIGTAAAPVALLLTDALSKRARTALATPSSFPGSAMDAAEMYGAPIAQTFCDVYDGGFGVIAGTVKEKHIPANIPLHRRVLLIEQRSQRVIRETWSDAVTGAYEFRGITLSTYTVVSFDHTGAYRAVISDSQVAV